jgi:hypothetical protein
MSLEAGGKRKSALVEADYPRLARKEHNGSLTQRGNGRVSFLIPSRPHLGVHVLKGGPQFEVNEAFAKVLLHVRVEGTGGIVQRLDLPICALREKMKTRD